MAKIKRIALLATGDELVHGEILNTNGQYIAQAFFDHGIETGVHMIVADDQVQLEKAIRYLLQDHHALITIGGLGPTSDDRTRFALADALVRPLEFNEASWQRIVNLLRSKKLDVSESNRQQAFFPKEADIIPNANGTADACHINHDGKSIYMLPGPPNEFKPIFDEVVFPHIFKANFAHPVFHKNWMLFGVSESQIAEHVDPIVAKTEVQVGYRVQYPYLELKLHAEDEHVLNNVSEKIMTELNASSSRGLTAGSQPKFLFGKFLLSSKQYASKQLCELLASHLHTKDIIWINDQVTHGLLQHTLDTPQTLSCLHFGSHEPKKYNIKVSLQGLDDYWQQKSNWDFSKMTIDLQSNDDKQTHQEKIPNRGQLTLTYAVELIAWHLLKFLAL